MSTWPQLATLLTGSVIGFLIREGMIFLHKYFDHHRELDKATYIKRLEAGEKTVAYFTYQITMQTVIGQTYKVITKAVDENKSDKLHLDYIRGLLVDCSKRLQELSGERLLEMSAGYLYFDLEDAADFTKEDSLEFIQATSDVQSINRSMEFWIEQANETSETDPEQSQMCYQYWRELFPEYSIAMKKLISLNDKNISACKHSIQRVRQQLKGS